MCLNILCLNEIPQLQCVCVFFRSCGQRRVSGWDDGLQADADGGFLSESWDRAALSQWDWESLFRSAPQRTNAALPNEGRPRRHGRHRSQLSEGGEMAFIIFTVWLQKHLHRYHCTDLPAWTQLFDRPTAIFLHVPECRVMSCAHFLILLWYFFHPQLQTLIQEADPGADYRIDRALNEACESVIQTACKHIRSGDPMWVLVEGEGSSK